MNNTSAGLSDPGADDDILPENLSNCRIVVYGMNYSPEIAGVGKYTGEIADYLARSGAEVHVVTTPPHYPGWAVQKGYANRYSVRNEDSITVYRVPLLLRTKMTGIWRLLAPLSFALTSAPVVFWTILRKRPGRVFCVEPTLFAAPVALLAAKIVGAKTVLHVQDLEIDAAFAVGHLGSHPWLKWLAQVFERNVIRRFGEIITISNMMATRIVEKGVSQARVSVVRNWVDLNHIYPLHGPNPFRRELGLSTDDFVVLYSGNIGAKQGLSQLLDAAVLVKENEGIKFIIAGEGPSKTELIRQYGWLSTVQFLPFQSYERLNAFLNVADVHVLPQQRGAADLVLPSKLGGMLATGKFIIATATSKTELSDFLSGEATLCEPGDAKALSVEIAHLSENHDRMRKPDYKKMLHEVRKTVNISQLGMIVGK